MNREPQFSPLLRALIAGACIVIIVAGMKVAASIVNLVLLALLLAQSISPLQNWLMKKRFSPMLAVLVTLLMVVIGGCAVLFLFGVSIAGLIEKLPAYQEKLSVLWDRAKTLLSERGIDASKALPLDMFSPQQVIQFAGSFFGALAQALGDGLILIFIVVIMLLEFAAMQQKLSAGKYSRDSLPVQFEEINEDTRKFVGITGLVGLIQAGANVIVLIVLGVDFAITWGVLFFFLNFVPTIGFFLALIPPALIALLDYGWKKALFVVIGWYAINFIGDNIVKPKFMKKGLDISFLLILLGLIFWSWVLGPLGAILAIPLTLTVRRLILQFSSFKPDDLEGKEN